jgi:hypothetical protein
VLTDGAKFYVHPREVNVTLAGTIRVGVRGGRVIDIFHSPRTLNSISLSVRGVLQRIEAIM